MTANPPLLWASRGVVMSASSDSVRFDPGTGPGRYARALEALRSSGGNIAFASFTFDPDETGSIVEIPETVATSSPSGAGSPSSSGATVIDDGAVQWRASMEGALDAIATQIVDKVVVTRQVEVTFDSPPSLVGVFNRLVALQPDCYTFVIGGLVGASPELLVSLEDGAVSSLVLAGTALDAEGLRSEKMEREHEFSRASVLEGISPHLDTLEVRERGVRGFGTIKHLASRFEGAVTPGVTVLDLVAALHPTAAVAGTPADTALKIIKDLESRSRGRFGGPVGWFDKDGEGEFAVALRCGQFGGSRATLYAGGGIVDGSDVDTEYAETELKLRPMKRALGLA